MFHNVGPHCTFAKAVICKQTTKELFNRICIKGNCDSFISREIQTFAFHLNLSSVLSVINLFIFLKSFLCSSGKSLTFAAFEVPGNLYDPGIALQPEKALAQVSDVTLLRW